MSPAVSPPVRRLISIKVLVQRKCWGQKGRNGQAMRVRASRRGISAVVRTLGGSWIARLGQIGTGGVLPGKPFHPQGEQSSASSALALVHLRIVGGHNPLEIPGQWKLKICLFPTPTMHGPLPAQPLGGEVSA